MPGGGGEFKPPPTPCAHVGRHESACCGGDEAGLPDGLAVVVDPPAEYGGAVDERPELIG